MICAGIDLGTSNSSAAFSQGSWIEDLPLRQAAEDGLTIDSFLLPSFILIDSKKTQHLAHNYGWVPQEGLCGALARRLAKNLHTQVITSAKSWLSLANQNSNNRLLPIEAPQEQRISPLQAQARFLKHIRSEFIRHKLAITHLAITIPASFEPLARQYTKEAARLAGFTDIHLLEEPLAAFYNWLYHEKQNHRPKHVLVIDVGGGTTDFSILSRQKNGYRRVCAGPHLLLGGDNMDLFLALEKERETGKKFDAHTLSEVVQLAREMKEGQYIGPQTLSVLSEGSSLFGDQQIQIHFDPETIHQSLERGFFPVIEDFEQDFSAEDDSGLREFGLPYTRDARITEHLRRFLRKSGIMIDAVLFHGGGISSKKAQQAILDCLCLWQKKKVELLLNPEPRLGVSRGACIHGLSRNGLAERVDAALIRSYYLGVETASGMQNILVAPQGLDEGEVFQVEEKLLLKGNRQVKFPILNANQEIVALAVATPRTKEAMNKVELQSRISVSSDLVLQIKSAGIELLELEFQPVESLPHSGRLEASLLLRCNELIDSIFRESSLQKKDKELSGLNRALEDTLKLKKKDWSLDLCRYLARQLIACRKGARRTFIHERLYFNLLGFCLRPGFGHAFDADLLGSLSLVDFTAFPNEVQNRLEYWILLRRLAGGLKEDFQNTLYTSYEGYLKGHKPAVRLPGMAPQKREIQEMVKTFASFEYLPLVAKTFLFENLTKQFLNQSLEKDSLFALSRLLLHHPLYAPKPYALPFSLLEPFLQKLLQTDHPEAKTLLNPLLQSIPDLAGSQTVLQALAKKLNIVLKTTEIEEKSLYGEDLPLGLKLSV